MFSHGPGVLGPRLQPVLAQRDASKAKHSFAPYFRPKLQLGTEKGGRTAAWEDDSWFPCSAFPGSHAPHGNPFFGAPRRWIVDDAELPRKWTQSVRRCIPMRSMGTRETIVFAVDKISPRCARRNDKRGVSFRHHALGLRKNGYCLVPHDQRDMRRKDQAKLGRQVASQMQFGTQNRGGG